MRQLVMKGHTLAIASSRGSSPFKQRKVSVDSRDLAHAPIAEASQNIWTALPTSGILTTFPELLVATQRLQIR